MSFIKILKSFEYFVILSPKQETGVWNPEGGSGVSSKHLRHRSIKLAVALLGSPWASIWIVSTIPDSEVQLLGL